MTILALKKHYSRFLKGHEGKLHFAAHSHHFWPDISRDAHLEYWDDSALQSDAKWNKIFSSVIPKAQEHIARLLNLKKPRQIVFAPNTHELGARILSLFLDRPSVHVLTTSSEFHSWRRQLQRLEEIPTFKVSLVPTDTLLENRRSFIDSLKKSLEKTPDIFFISQVFFDSGVALSDEELIELREACPIETVMVVDGYHAFAALPSDLSRLEGKIFYLAGGYKYAQAGEGACFLVVPEGNWRPAYTGWFAEFGELSKPSGKNVGYTQDGGAFFGATQDFSGLYRLNAVWDWLTEQGLNLPQIHEHVVGLQRAFIKRIYQDLINAFKLRPLFHEDLKWHGHFLTFQASSEEKAAKIEEDLKGIQIIIDRRGTRLRFGFGLYQDQEDIEDLAERLKLLVK
jgi:selenocysteine lyase/cysteine desulfurase